MKTKTIDRLIFNTTELINKSFKPKHVDSLILDEVVSALNKEKQRKEQKKKESYNDHGFAYANGIALGIDPNYNIEQKKEIMDRCREKQIIKNDYVIGYQDAIFLNGIKNNMLTGLCEQLNNDKEFLIKTNKELLSQLHSKKPKPSIVDCISVMIQQVKNSDYKPNIIQFIEDDMIIEMQITDNKVILKRKN